MDEIQDSSSDPPLIGNFSIGECDNYSMDKRSRAVFAALLVFAAALAVVCATVGTLDRPTIAVTQGCTAGACIEGMSQRQRLFLGLKMDADEVCADELKLIPGIGEVKAKKIIDFRDGMGGIEDLEDLVRIPGIGRNDVRNLKDFLQ